MSNKTKLLWQNIDWSKVKSRIDRLQKRIYKFSLTENKGRVIFLQHLLINSLDAKLLAVHRVTSESQGCKISGIDHLIYITPEQKMTLAKQLVINGKAPTMRTIWIPKLKTPKSKPFSIPIIKDRVKQKLVLLALEPEWEAHFEPNSYGFRPGKSTHDAMQAIWNIMRNERKNYTTGQYVFHADLKGCFDSINHNYLLKQLNAPPKISAQVASWLKVGIFESLRLDPKYDVVVRNAKGMPQGRIIAPFLVNVALHGMEIFLKEWICSQKWPTQQKHENYTANKIKSIGLVRYADCFVVIHQDLNIISAAKEAISQWLANTSQVPINEDKSKIIHSSMGFNFLGFSVITINRKGLTRCKITPSNKIQKKLVQEIGDKCRKYRSISTFKLIESLRPTILAWGNHYCYCECKPTFSKLDRSIFQIIRAWVFRRDTRQGRNTVKEKYFPEGRIFTYDGRSYQNNWILVGQKKQKSGHFKENFLPKLSWIKSKKYVKVRNVTSIYSNENA
uniref:putative reverse transcriptase/maturase n=1 Tax=Glaucosphaera vacuolata TaxID=38265 RepID=UPI001FCDA8FC|nr:putative reverse transcriptase/maturase [Glaucosphaera vacuolata]UNJ18639.1 putative reverse transcriptase/maturase [Glaucosphaera vacuolata]